MALCAVVAGALPSKAQAQVEVPDGCGSEAELRSELERLLGEETAKQAWPDRLRIEATAEGGYALALSVKGEPRSVRDADCRALFKSAVVMAAVAVDPTAAERSKAAESQVEAKAKKKTEEAAAATDSETDSDSEPEPEPEPEPESDSPTPLHLSAALGGGAVAGVQPLVAPVAELSVSLMRGPIGVALAGRYLFESRASKGGRAVDVDGFGGRLTALYEPLAWLHFAAGVGLDQLNGQGVGRAGVTGSAGTGTRVALVVEAAARPLTFGQLWIEAALSGEYALARPSFEITGYGTVYQVPEVAGALVVRVGWEFL